MGFYEPLKDFVLWLSDRGEKLNQAEDGALRAIQLAINRTKQYEEGLASSSQVDRDKEFELSELWFDAAAKAKLANNELALRLGKKARYWSDSERWPREKVVAAGITLTSLEDDVERLLGGR